MLLELLDSLLEVWSRCERVHVTIIPFGKWRTVEARQAMDSVDE
jgi:predicted membrane chloride channel (bestrophin family)